jgi:hypothetical protein
MARSSIVTCVLLTSLTAFALGADTDFIKSVKDAWQKREEATRSLECEIVEENIKGKDARPRRDKDFKATLKLSLLIDGDRMRYTRSGERLLENGIAAQQEYTSVFDAKVSKSLYKRPRNDDTMHHQGFISNKSEHMDARSLYIFPLIAHYKPLSHGRGIMHLDRWRFVRKEKVNDVEALLFEDPPGDESIRQHLFWIAPSRGMALVRYTSTVVTKNMLENQLDVTVGPDGKGGWIPESWRLVFFGDDVGKGEASKFVRASATSRTVSAKTNIDVPAAMFDIEFPVGTEVNDYRQKKAYIMMQEKRVRPILPVELSRGATYSELASTSPGEARRTNEGKSFGWVRTVLACIGFLGICAGGLFLARSRFLSPHSTLRSVR